MGFGGLLKFSNFHVQTAFATAENYTRVFQSLARGDLSESLPGTFPPCEADSPAACDKRRHYLPKAITGKRALHSHLSDGSSKKTTDSLWLFPVSCSNTPRTVGYRALVQQDSCLKGAAAEL